MHVVRLQQPLHFLRPGLKPYIGAGIIARSQKNMAAYGPDTREYRTLQHDWDVIIKTLAATVDPAGFARRLQGVSLITDDIVQKASVKGILTGSERISPVMDVVKAQIRLKAELFVTFMGVLKEVNPQLWSVVDNYHTSSGEQLPMGVFGGDGADVGETIVTVGGGASDGVATVNRGGGAGAGAATVTGGGEAGDGEVTATVGDGASNGEVTATVGVGASDGDSIVAGDGGASDEEGGAYEADMGDQPKHPSDIIFDKYPECKEAPPLGIDDLGQVLRVLHDAGLDAKWRAIGQILTVSDANLVGFDARFSGDPSLCLLHVVASWLCGQKIFPSPPLRWRLVYAVADPQGGDTVLKGMEIAATFKENRLSKFVPTSTYAKNTPPKQLLNDFSGDPHIYGSVDRATMALSRELSAVSNKWIQIAVLLGVKFSWLEQRRSARLTDQQNLHDMLHHWLNSLSDVTLQRLVEAVEHCAGGCNPMLAAAIKNKLLK